MSSLGMRDEASTDLLPSGLRPRPWGRRVGTYIHVYIIAGIAVPLMIYLTLMQSLCWPTPSWGLNGFVGYTAQAGDEVVLYDSSGTRAFLASQGGDQDRLLNAWRDYLKDRGYHFREIQDASQIRDLRNGVLILASSVALSAQERTEIDAFRSRGGALLMTWATGTRSEKGEWLGWDFLAGEGFNFVEQVKDATQTNHLIVDGETPVSHALQAGQRIFLSPTSEPLIVARGGAVGARFMDWARTPRIGHEDEGAVLYNESSPMSGRTVYFGFAESTWSAHPVSIYVLLDDTLAWLRRVPHAVLAAWPSGHRAASVIEMDTEEGFPNAMNFAALVDAADHPASFFLLTSVASKFPDVVRQLQRGHEFGYHGDVHTGFKASALEDQEKRVTAMQAELRPLVANPGALLGFRAPKEEYDATTEKVLQAHGIRYHVADPNRSDARLPLMAGTPGSTPDDDLVVLPRTQRDDLNLLKQTSSSDELNQALMADTDLALDNGGLALLSIHTQNFAANSLLARAMPGMLLHARQLRDRLWLTTTGEVAHWWRQRERIKISPSLLSRRLEVAVTVLGEQPVVGATLIVFLPQRDVSVVVKSIKLGGVIPEVKALDPYRKILVFPGLAPGNYSYQITFGN